MRIVIAMSILLTTFSTAFGEEILNLELQCDGVMTVDSPALELLSLFGAGTSNKEPFSARLSIKNNILGSEGPRLKVTDTRIYLREKKEINEADLSGTLEIFEIDRLTGALDLELVVSKPTNDTTEAIAITFQVDGKCEKLDPKKKKF